MKNIAGNFKKSIFKNGSKRKKIFFILSFLGLIFCLLCFEQEILKSYTKHLTVIDKEEIKEFKTYKKTIGETLSNAYVFSEGDKICLESGEYKFQDALDQVLLKETKINILRAFPVYISCDSQRKKVLTTKKKVGDILTESMCFAYDKDLVTPGLDELVNPEDEIRVTRISENVIYITEPIEYESIKKETNELLIGNTKILKEGKKGTKELAYKVRLEDNLSVSRELLGEKIIEEKVDEIVGIGTKKNIRQVLAAAKNYPNERYFIASSGTLTSRNGSNIRYKAVLNCEATAYDASYRSTGKNPGSRGYGITASGEKVRYGVVAVDPRVIPLGTKLYIESCNDTWVYGLATALDTGGLIKGNKIDLYFDTEQEALNFGRKQAKVYILDSSD